MPADALNTSVARTSKDMLLTMQKNQVLAFFSSEKGEFPEPALFHCQYI